ncbi:dihydrolipoyl dehydrogenase [bacterium]|nr:dihydrolipoyl dehydrogenase [candidate division CSSED10-310 bacterium]
MVVGTASKGCQVAVIGGGPGGYLAAIRLAQLGKDVILIEKSEFLGGVCLNVGCIPSKALIHVADFLEEVKESDRMGVTVEGVSLNLENAIHWKDKIVRKLTGGVKFLAEKNGVDIIKGFAGFDTERRLNVQTDSGPLFIEFEQAVVCTGSEPKPIPDLSVDGNKIIGPTEALSLSSAPGKLAIVGGGYIGLELGSVFRRFGSEVTIIEAMPDILSMHDPEVRSAIRKRIEILGIDLKVGVKLQRVETNDRITLFLNKKGSDTVTVAADVVMVAAGRVPSSRNMRLTEIGVKTDDQGFIEVNDRMETSIPGIYAVGDVIGPPLLAHKAYREAKVVAEVIAGHAAAFDNVVIPAVVYTDPELAWAGLTELEAVRQGFNVLTGMFPFRASGRAMTLNAEEGFVKTVADAETKRILGVTILGKDASEMISEAALAIEMGAFLDDLSQTIHPHPTLSEGLLESVEAALGEAVHILNKKS